MSSDIETLKKAKPPFEAVLADIHRYSSEGIEQIPEGELDLYKWYGIYPQRPQEENFLMLRVKVPGGALSGAALRVVAQIADDFGRGFLDVSDRQAFQFHYLRLENIPEIFDRLEAVGLHTRGACGDTVRAIITSPIAGLDAREVFDVNALSREMDATFSGNPAYQDLPRKYKVSITGTPQLEGIHLINDLSFLAHEIDGPDGQKRVGFDVWVGGGLGAVAFLARRLGVFIAPEEVLEVMHAITGAYRDHGYRKNRKQSRLKYLLKDLGPEKFLEIVETEYLGRTLERGPAAPVAPNGGVDVLGINPQKDGRFYLTVATTVGRISPDNARALADLVEQYGSGEIRTTAYQNMLIPNITAPDLEAVTKALEGLELAPKTTLRGTTIACTGNQFCRLALTETKARTASLIDALESKFEGLDVPVTINLTGCSNACTRYQVADLGFMGANHLGEEVFQVHLGGSLGAAQRLGAKLKGRIPAAQLQEYVNGVLEQFEREKGTLESFTDFVDRVGAERFSPDVILAKPVKEAVLA
ncbi:MAG: nitrite/sulfite reductase [Pseudopedobacter sp.]|nr:nitrite/sulfite reductase [Deinococcales bacterium]